LAVLFWVRVLTTDILYNRRLRAARGREKSYVP
jgi:hypothetical protein